MGLILERMNILVLDELALKFFFCILCLIFNLIGVAMKRYFGLIIILFLMISCKEQDDPMQANDVDPDELALEAVA